MFEGDSQRLRARLFWDVEDIIKKYEAEQENVVYEWGAQVVATNVYVLE